MAVTETWKYYSTMAVMKGVSLPFTTVYLGLGVSGFSVGAGDTAVGEVSGTGYARQPITWTDFVADMSNSGEILFAVTGPWGSVGAAFLSDASQGGKVIAYTTVTNTTVTSGDSIRVPVGNLVLT